MESQSEEKNNDILNDDVYISRYAEIGEMYYAKRAAIRELKGADSKDAAGRIAELNVMIKKKEGVFMT